MPREFLVYADDTGSCVLKVDTEPVTQRFTDLIAAISHVRALKGTDMATLFVFDAVGQLVFTQTL